MKDTSPARPGAPGAQRARHFAIAELVLQHGSVSMDELVEQTGVSLTTVYRHRR